MKLQYQASSEGGFILSGELVRSVDRSTLPFTPIPDWFHSYKSDVCDYCKDHKLGFPQIKSQEVLDALHEVLEDGNAEGVSQGACWE